MQSVMKAVFSRATLVMVVVLLLCGALWLLGPLLTLGTQHPLEGAGARAAVIALLLVAALFVVLEFRLGFVGVVALALSIWYVGPQLSLGSTPPLASVNARVWVIGALFLVFLIREVLLLRRRLQSNDALLNWLIGKPSAKGEEKESAKDAHVAIRAMRSTAQQAVARLKHMRASAGWLRRLLEGRRYLYELPWYLVVGNSGAGKTTALLNAGLQFPLAEQMGAAAVLARERGTPLCDWWFTHDAVLVDTAGRFTTPGEGTAAADAAEWRGLLGVLRRARPRAPVNGALLTVDATELMLADRAGQLKMGGVLRERLEELRNELGIRFPVYLVVTKCDALQGFAEYFGALTAEGRAQVWGFTLPWAKAAASVRRRWRRGATARAQAEAQVAFSMALNESVQALHRRVAQGIPGRLQEEFEPAGRQRLYALPHEFAGLAPALLTLVEAVFSDSRFDGTTDAQLLRGVYFTSASQERLVLGSPASEQSSALSWLGAQSDGVFARLMASQGERSAAGSVQRVRTSASEGARRQQRSFFLADLMSRVVFPESHLVRPNLRWEARQRLAGWLGHALVALLVVWLGSALLLSERNNRAYLAAAQTRADALRPQVRALLADFHAPHMPDALTAAQDLPRQVGLDPADPPLGFRYGLYTGDDLRLQADRVYASLQDHLLLPRVAARVAQQLAQALNEQDAEAAYGTLRVYLMLFDPARYSASELRAWVMHDWQTTDGLAAAFGGRAVMLEHLQSLFADGRFVRSAGVADAALVTRARQWLDGTTTSTRLYERTKAQLAADGPADFTLVRALGPQAGTLFARASGRPLEQGVPGLFTYDGYHQVFSRRLVEMIARAALDDGWVMGQRLAARSDAVAGGQEAELLAQDVRRQFLQEYARRWTEFLDDVRVVGGANLAFDLNVLRQLAAPDSPLARLARAAARETTLSTSLVATPAVADRSLLDQAGATLDKVRDGSRALGVRAESRLERAEVDDRFAALREVVTGQVDAQTLAGSASAARPPALDAVTGLVNDYYTVLVVADTALSGGAVPPGAADVGARVRLEATRLPAPFREVLLGLGTSAAARVTEGAQAVLRLQARGQLDRINGLLALQVTEPCRRALEGRYPFVAGEGGSPEVVVEDFQLLFATGGALDDYFARNLLTYVDASVRPWRYKHPAAAAMLVPAVAAAADGSGAMAPSAAVAGPTLTGELLRLLAESGPDLEVFYRASQIRDVFFREGGRRLGWKTDLRVSELDPTITELVMDFDGQGQRYAHGPVQPWSVTWPGPRGGASAELMALPRIRADTSVIQTRGPWSLLRLLERGRPVGTASPGRVAVEFSFDNRRVVLDLSSSGSLPHPLTSQLLRGFTCPGGRRAA